jgi:hypothetical protein
MLKPSFAKVFIAGLLLGAGSVQAASAFPSAAEEVPAAWYAHTIQTAPAQATSAPHAAFPAAALENGSSHETYVEARPSRIGAGIMGAIRAMFPSSANETAPLNL